MESEHGLGGVSLEGLLGVLFNSSASLKRKSEKLYWQQDLQYFPPDLRLAPPVSLLSRKGTYREREWGGGREEGKLAARTRMGRRGGYCTTLQGNLGRGGRTSLQKSG